MLPNAIDLTFFGLVNQIPEFLCCHAGYLELHFQLQKSRSEVFAHDLAPATSLSERFQVIVARQLELMMLHREALGALFGMALNPRSKVGVFSKSTVDIRRQGREIYLGIILGAKDAPKRAISQK